MQPQARNEFKSTAKSVREYAYTEDCNFKCRPAMEDDHFTRDNFLEDDTSGLFGILDGHGGGEVAKYCVKSVPDAFDKFYDDNENNIEKLFQITFAKVDDELRMKGAQDSGSTVCVCFVRKENTSVVAHIANLGDTRAIIVRENGFERITVDHKASDPSEIERIQKAGGFVMKDRVSGQLAVTRALGDLALKKEGVINVPYYRKIPITSNDKYIIMATDGLWDVVDDQGAYEIAKGLKDSQEISKSLVATALKNGSRDNVSVFVLKFN